MAVPYLSVIIPAYNEAARISATLESLARYLSEQPYEWEVIVVDDGSDDDTAMIAESWAAAHDGFRVERVVHGGKGFAVRHGMLAACGEYRLMCDADLAMPVVHIADFVAQMRRGYDVVIGSRQIAGANRYGESQFRHMRGRIFNKMVRIALIGGFDDTQCGFKCFTAAAAATLFGLQRTRGWGFDVELLYIARRCGMSILEMPIDWYHDEQSKINAATTSFAMLWDMLAVRWRAVRGMYDIPQGNQCDMR